MGQLLCAKSLWFVADLPVEHGDHPFCLAGFYLIIISSVVLGVALTNILSGSSQSSPFCAGTLEASPNCSTWKVWFFPKPPSVGYSLDEITAESRANAAKMNSTEGNFFCFIGAGSLKDGPVK